MNDNRKRGSDLEINVGEMIFILMRKWWLIALAGILCAAVFLVGTKVFITPKYQAVTKIFVLSQQDVNHLTSTDIQLSSYLTKDYAELIKSRTVAQEVIERLELNMDPETLMSQLDVQTKSDTRIVTIVVENESPELARNLADVIREVSAKQIVDVMGVEAVNVVDMANLPSTPSSPNLRKSILMGGICGCMLVIILIMLQYLLDDTIKTEEDVERHLDLTVLASIPTIEQPTSKKGGKFSCQTSK